MGGAAGSGDDDSQASGRGGFGVGEHEVGRTVRGDYTDFVWDAELTQDVDGCAHYRVVIAAAHDYADDCSRDWFRCHCHDYTIHLG
jgi:hypothetical protein